MIQMCIKIYTVPGHCAVHHLTSYSVFTFFQTFCTAVILETELKCKITHTQCSELVCDIVKCIQM